MLTGGILAGQSLIRASELRSVIQDYQRFVAATQAFRDKYMALPGDMPNAISFWGAASTEPATCITTIGTGTQTCNGNGDGIIFPSAGSDESYRFWQQLANAGLIEGSYDGITHGSTDYSSTSANSPKGRISNTLWFVWNWGAPVINQGQWFDGDYGNRLSIGNPMPNAEPVGALFKAEEAWNIDTKLDDGQPGHGKVMTQWGNADCNNGANSTDTNAVYTLSASTLACFLVFPHAF